MFSCQFAVVNLQLRAIEKGLLAPLFCEDDLGDKKLKAPIGLFPEDFIKGLVLTRQAANTLLSAAEDASSEQVKDMLTGKSGFLV